MVLPYYHSGMGAVMPYKAIVPRVGHNVTITFGEPVELDDVTCNCNKDGVSQEQVWRDITARVRSSLQVRPLDCLHKALACASCSTKCT